MSGFSLVEVFCACGTQDKLEDIAHRLESAGMQGQSVDHNGLTINGLMNESVCAELQTLQQEGLVHSFRETVIKKPQPEKPKGNIRMFGQDFVLPPRNRFFG